MYALLAAALFGASMPFAKTLVGQVAPVTLAGILYLGSGLGLLACFLVCAVLARNNQAPPHAHGSGSTLARGGDRLRRDCGAGLADVWPDAHACLVGIATAQYRGRAHGDVGLVRLQGKFRPSYFHRHAADRRRRYPAVVGISTQAWRALGRDRHCRRLPVLGHRQ